MSEIVVIIMQVYSYPVMPTEQCVFLILYILWYIVHVHVYILSMVVFS